MIDGIAKVLVVNILPYINISHQHVHFKLKCYMSIISWLKKGISLFIVIGSYKLQKCYKHRKLFIGFCLFELFRWGWSGKLF